MLVIFNLLVLMKMKLLLEVTCENIAVVVLLLVDSTEVLTSVHLQVINSTLIDVLITRNLSAVVVVDIGDTRFESRRSFMDMLVIMMVLDDVGKPSTTSGGRGTIRSM